LSEQIVAHAEGMPEGTPVSAKSLLHLGNRAAVDQALSRRPRRLSASRDKPGWHAVAFGGAGRRGARQPARRSHRAQWAAAANTRGLTTRVPVRSVYLTSGRTRKMNLSKQVVELRHEPRWQLALASRPAGEVARALAWLGPEKADAALLALKRNLPQITLNELVVAPQLPTWLARSVGKAAHG